MLQRVFVSKKALDKKYVRWYKEMHDLAHDVSHGMVKQLDGADIDENMNRVIAFEKTMRAITTKLISKEKIIRIEKK